MSTFVLVHGAWHGSWCWNRVRRGLQAEGHEVFTPTLTGLSERQHLVSPDIDLDTHVDDIVNLILHEDLTDIVLCGHSYGGGVVTGVADRVPERIDTLVYLDAFVPRNGQSLHDLLPPDTAQGQIDLAGDGWRVPPIPAEFFNVNAADRAWVDAQCTPQPLATFQQKLRLTGGGDTIGKVTYILASGWGPSPFTGFHAQAQADGWTTRDLACGHDVMLDMPGELVAELLAARDAAPVR